MSCTLDSFNVRDASATASFHTEPFNIQHIMKKYFFLSFFLLSLAPSAFSQQYDVLEKVKSDPRKMAAMEGMHRFDSVSISRPPKGYKPFYINHYARHGSRYSCNSSVYQGFHEDFSKADSADVLTPAGKRFFEQFEQFYKYPLINTGDLLPRGFEEHKKIGGILYDSFPEVFRKNKRVEALSSLSERCIVSMGACSIGMMSRDRNLDIVQRADHAGMAVIVPPGAPKPLKRTFKGQFDEPRLPNQWDYYDEHIDYKSVLLNFFTDPYIIDTTNRGWFGFCRDIFTLTGNYKNHCYDARFDGIIPEDQMLMLWEAFNYNSFYGDINRRYAVIPLLEDFMRTAEDAIAGNGVAANLRFGHDWILEAFLTLINVNNMGVIPETVSDVKYWFQSYVVEMAANVEFVLYKNRPGDIIFKVVLNESDATLPYLTPVSGCYYKWSDFRDWVNKLLADHPQINQ